MTLIQIFAFLSVLTAFGVPQPTIDQIHKILIPENTTPVVLVPTTITPVIQDAPIYFGSTAPVIPTPPPIVVAPVVESIVMDKSEIIVVETRQRPSNPTGNQPFGSVLFILKVVDIDGGDITKSAQVTMQAPNNIYGESVQASNTGSGNLFYVPTTGGEKTITFTSGELTKEITLTF